MRTRFTKIGFVCTTVLMCLSTASAEKTGNIEFPGFVKQIECRKGVGTEERTLPADPTEGLVKNARRLPSRFVGWNGDNPSKPEFVAKSNEAGEQMDSVVGILLNGNLMSKQEFRFTDNGLPLECRNFTPAEDGSSFQYAGHFAYEYDDLQRVIAAEKLDIAYPSSSQRMEFSYDGDSYRYNLQIAYLMNGDMEWYPFQKGEYEFDDNGNTIEETYFSWSDEEDDWIPVQKTTASYDELNRMTSYFPFTWDAESGQWIGYSMGASRGQRFEYTQAGKDALIADFEWMDGEWIEYFRTIFTYNDSALVVKKERLYWNRTSQDWSGGETWGQFGYVYYNEYETYEYDEYGRNTELDVFTSKNGAYENYYRQTITYAPLEDNGTEKTDLKGNVSADGVFDPYAKTIQHFNSHGSETYYISYRSIGGEWIPQQEEFRYFDDYNWFIGGDYYSFMNGERKPNSKEQFIYPEDFNPTLGYETPIEGRHWIGLGMGDDAQWKLKHVDCFTWGPRDVMTGFVNYDYLQSEGCRTSGWEIEYDFSANMSDVFIWPDNNKRDAYYENKTLSSTTYSNYNYWNGNDEWMPEFSYVHTYYYSPRTTTGIDSAEVPEGVTEIARFDLTGRRLSEPSRGINIVRYSDGSSRKTTVR